MNNCAPVKYSWPVLSRFQTDIAACTGWGQVIQGVCRSFSIEVPDIVLDKFVNVIAVLDP